MVPPICMKSSGLGLRSPKVAAIPEVTPIRPRALPILAVDWEDRPLNAPTQQREAAKYVI